MSLESIPLFPVVELLPNLDKIHAIKYLKRYCTIDDLGDSIYVKKLGNDKTTFAIDFESKEITLVRKIKDEKGCNLNEIIFENCDECYPSDVDCDDVTETNYGVNS
jgi:hypothetical protein